MKEFVTFYIGGLIYGVEIFKVQEILKHAVVTPVPRADEAVTGLINLRGHVITVLDLSECLQPTNTLGAGKDNCIIIISTESMDEPMGIRVNEIGDVIQLDETLIDLAPPHLDEDSRKNILGVYKGGEKLITLLDIESVFTNQLKVVV